MRLDTQCIFVLLLLYNVVTIIPSVLGQDFQQSFRIVAMEADRDKRAIDLGFLVRNFLMKSAYASNTKAAVSRNLINAKATITPRPTTTQRPTTTTTTLAPIFNKNSFWFPFSASFGGGFPPINNVNGPTKVGFGVGPRPGPPLAGPRGGGAAGGAFNFDYDYIDQLRPIQPSARRRRPTTTTAAPTTTTTTPAPPPPTPALPFRRRPLPKRPSFLHYDYYDDYDYGEVEPTTAAAPASTQPPPAPRPSARARRPQQNQAARIPPRSGVRQDRPAPPARLRNPPIYQYAQTNDFSTNNAAAAANAGNAGGSANPNNDNQSTNDETSQDTNANDNDDNASANDDDAANDPTNSEDYNDSSDNSNANPNPNGNGSNGNNINFNNADSGQNEPPQQPPVQNPLFDFDNANPPPQLPFNNPPGGGPFQPQFIDPQNFNGRRFNNPRGPALPPLNQPYSLASQYQNYQYPGFSDFGSQYQPPSSPAAGFSVRYY